jgi:hypothetical protein
LPRLQHQQRLLLLQRLLLALPPGHVVPAQALLRRPLRVLPGWCASRC